MVYQKPRLFRSSSSSTKHHRPTYQHQRGKSASITYYHNTTIRKQNDPLKDTATMSNLTHLANSFQYMDLEKKKPQYHELQIEYPVLDLLPAEESVTPYLLPPSFSGYRENPDPSGYHLPLSGIDFIARLPLTTDMPTPLQDEFFATLTTILCSPGRSLLQFVSYSHPEDGVYWRFRLSTECNGKFQTIAESELSSIAWTAERRVFLQEPWLLLVSHLLGRMSDRAYFHVHERLKHYSWHKKQIAEEQWNYKDSFDPKQFFAKNLRVVVVILGRRYSQDVDEYDFEGVEAEEERAFLLPCGHESDMSFDHLRSFSASGCLHARCEDSGTPLVKKGSLRRLRLLNQTQRERRARFSVHELVWQRVAAEYPIGTQQVSVRSGVLYKALSRAAHSVQPPDSISPAPLRPLRTELFVRAANELWSQLQGDYEVACT